MDRHLGICSIYMQKKNDMLILYNFDMLVKFWRVLKTLIKLVDNIPSLSVSTDSYHLSKTLAPSTAHKAIVDGVHLNHVISIEGLEQVIDNWIYINHYL